MSSERNGEPDVNQTNEALDSKPSVAGEHGDNQPSEAQRSVKRKKSVAADEMQRTDALTWDQYFMGVALISAQTNKDTDTQVGACIVNPRKRIVGVGYHNMLETEKDPENKQTNKDLYVCHAEMNAIVNRVSADLQDCKIYITKYPCNKCSQMIIQSGIRKVVYLGEKDPDSDKYAASRHLLKTANIKIKEYKKDGNLNFQRLAAEFNKL